MLSFCEMSAVALVQFNLGVCLTGDSLKSVATSTCNSQERCSLHQGKRDTRSVSNAPPRRLDGGMAV